MEQGNEHFYEISELPVRQITYLHIYSYTYKTRTYLPNYL